MSFTLDHVVPWGRGFDEYQSMFCLSGDDLRKHILGCGDGPASFNAKLTQRGGSIISIDPLYRFSTQDIKNRIKETYPKVLDHTRQNAHQFNWVQIGSVENLGRVRMKAMEEFLSDFSEGQRTGRSLNASLPSLPFREKEFQLALCSHLLFLYSDQFSYTFHFNSIVELCRIALEVRIFPLVDLHSNKSLYLDPLLLHLEEVGCQGQIEKTSYEFQKGGNEMLRVIHGS